MIALNASTLNVTGSWQVPDVEGEDSDFGSTPTLFATSHGVPMVVASNKNGLAYALNRSNVSVNGTWYPAWNLSTGGGFSGAAFDGRTLYLAGDGVYAVDPDNGSVLWQAPMDGGGYITGSLSYANGLVYAGGGSEVEAIDAANGSVLWNATLPGGLSTVTEPVVAGNELFVAGGDYGTSGALTAYGLPAGASYPVVFQQSGLPAGKSWVASVNGLTRSSADDSITFYEPNGSYAYLIEGPGGFEVRDVAPGGTVNVSGAETMVSFDFAAGPTFGVTFQRSGLAAGTPWCAEFSGAAPCSVRGAIHVRNLTAGTYAYAGGPIAGETLTIHWRGAVVPNAGSEALAKATTFYLHYVVTTYAVVFEETGLAARTGWSVKVSETIDGHTHAMTHSSRTDTIVFALANGTYAFTVKVVLHYTGNFSGTLSVVAAPVEVNVTFVRDATLFPYPSEATPPPPPLGLARP